MTERLSLHFDPDKMKHWCIFFQMYTYAYTHLWQFGCDFFMGSVFKSINMFLHVCVLSHYFMSDPVTPWTVACQAPLSMRFPRQKCWLPFISPWDGPHLGIEPAFPALAGGSLPLSHRGHPNMLLQHDFLFFSFLFLKNVFGCAGS